MAASIGSRRTARPEQFRRLIDAIELGMDVRAAATYAGIGRPTFYRWRDLAGAGREPFVSLFRRIEEAKVNAANSALRREIEEIAATMSQSA